jgi:hypothetical protein
MHPCTASRRRPKVPVTHTYFHYDNPPANARSRRYIAYQMEYSRGKIKSSTCQGYMGGAMAAWEYTSDQLQFWHDSGIANVTQVGGRVGRVGGWNVAHSQLPARSQGARSALRLRCPTTPCVLLLFSPGVCGSAVRCVRTPRAPPPTRRCGGVGFLPWRPSCHPVWLQGWGEDGGGFCTDSSAHLSACSPALAC